MSPSQDEKKRTRAGGRYSFDQDLSENGWPAWHLPDDPSFAVQLAAGIEVNTVNATEDDPHEKHEPAPMQKRAKTTSRNREPRRPDGWGPVAIIGAMIILASFAIAFDFASSGKVKQLMLWATTSSESIAPADEIAGGETSAPVPQESAQAPEPVAPQAKATPPAPQISPALPGDTRPIETAQVSSLNSPLAATSTEPVPAIQPVPEPTEPPSLALLLEAAAKAPIAEAPAAKLPNPQEPPPIAADAAVQAGPAESPQQETEPISKMPVDTAKQAAPAAPAVLPQLQGSVVRDCAECPELVAVSAGVSLSLEAANASAPAKIVSVNHDFAIGRNDITFDDWDKCVTDGGCKAIAEDGGWGRGRRPQIFISFDDLTTQYLPWLSKLTGHVYRLPSKDEWQYAALGGASAEQPKGQNAEGAQDCFNASGPPAGNCADTFSGTAPVASFPPNALGLYDMKGNVWEWSADCWRPFTYAPNTNSPSCDTRVVLGGAWSTGRSEVNGKIAGWEKSSARTNSIGFRVVRTLP